MGNVTHLTKPSLRVAHVIYFTDMTRLDARVIPLGAFAEIRLPGVYGLALKARSVLSETEMPLINILFREQIGEPFSFLGKEFDLAWESAMPGERLNFLASRHTTALSILAPIELDHISWWPFKRTSSEAKLSNAVDQAFDAVLKEYGDAVLKEYGDSETPKRKVVEIENDRKAA